jgi:hypothetical protein
MSTPNKLLLNIQIMDKVTHSSVLIKRNITYYLVATTWSMNIKVMKFRKINVEMESWKPAKLCGLTRGATKVFSLSFWFRVDYVHVHVTCAGGLKFLQPNTLFLIL